MTHLLVDACYFKKIISVLAIGLLPALTAAKQPSAPWRNDAICGDRLPAFESTEVKSCPGDAFCSSIDHETRVCACTNADETQTENVQLHLDYKGKIVKTWATEVQPMGLGPDSFRMDEFGWSQRGEKQTLLAVRQGQSNGMAVQSWSVWAIVKGRVSEPVQAEDYGLISFATRPQGSKHCQLLVSDWTPGQRGGLFAVGRWHDLHNDRFQPSQDRPQITRRYLFGFEKQRDKNRDSDVPLRWYSHPGIAR
jgi:hypothetical protein